MNERSSAPALAKVWRLVRFTIVGFSVMGAFMGLNALFGRWFSPHLAFFLSYGPAIALHFSLNKWWTFTDRQAVDARQVREYIAASIITFSIQWPVFTLAQTVMGLPGWLSAGIANAAQILVSFLLLQRRVFVARRQLASVPIPPTR